MKYKLIKYTIVSEMGTEVPKTQDSSGDSDSNSDSDVSRTL